MSQRHKDYVLAERNYHAIRKEACGSLNTISDSALHDMGVLDAKSADLLTFISVMLASLTFALGLIRADAPAALYVRVSVFAFMAAFALAAWIDLRCLYVGGPDTPKRFSNAAEYETTALAELHQRRSAYRLALRIAQTGFSLLAPFVLIWLFLAHRGLA